MAGDAGPSDRGAAAENFVAAPGFGFPDRIRWAGEDLYHRPGPVAP